MEQIGRSHLVDVRMQELLAIGGRGLSESGLERLDIPDAGKASVAGHLILVDLQHLGQTEEGWVHRLFRQLLQGLGVPCVHLPVDAVIRHIIFSAHDRSSRKRTSGTH